MTALCPPLPVELVCLLCECLVRRFEFRSLATLALVSRTYCAAANDELMWEHFTKLHFAFVFDKYSGVKVRVPWRCLNVELCRLGLFLFC